MKSCLIQVLQIFEYCIMYNKLNEQNKMVAYVIIQS
jgi:hypothetical protein